MKRILNVIWREFVFGGHLASIGPVIIVLIVCKLSGIRYPLDLLFCVYCITYLAYALDRYLDIKRDKNDPRLEYISKYYKLFPFIFLILLIIISILSFNNSIYSFYFVSIFVIIGFLYNIFLKKLTKSIIGFKSFFVAISYPATVFLIAPFTNSHVSVTMFLIFLFFFARVLDNTIFCDIKDIREDKLNNLKTIPIVLNSKRLNILLISINIASIIPIIYGYIINIFPAYSLLLIITSTYYFYYLDLSKKENADMQKMANFWADGELIVWLLIFLGGFIWN